MDFRGSKSVFSKKQGFFLEALEGQKKEPFFGPPIGYVKMSRQLGTVLIHKKTIKNDAN